MQLVSSAENSSLDWKAQYKYIEDIGDGRGYTAGIIGFCSGTGDMLELVEHYTDAEARTTCSPSTCPRCEKVNGSDSHTRPRHRLRRGLEDRRRGHGVPAAPRTHERDRVYFNPSVKQAKDDGLRHARPVHLLRRDRHARPRRRASPASAASARPP